MSDWKAAGRKERREDGAGKRPERGRRDDEAGAERMREKSKRNGERKIYEVTVGVWMRLCFQVYHVGLISAACRPQSVYAAMKFEEL